MDGWTDLEKTISLCLQCGKTKFNVCESAQRYNLYEEKLVKGGFMGQHCTDEKAFSQF